MEQMPLVTLTTDFGITDGYVGTMKGVILSIASNTRLVDISHRIAPQNVRQAAYVIYASYPFFPAHTVHLVVVDPGVGSLRRPVALRTPAGVFVGPDNGVFSYVVAREPVEALIELADPRYHLPQVGHTFHGRDIFAPVAAHLAAGVPITALGPAVCDPVTLPPPRLEAAANAAAGAAAGSVRGEVLHIDHFGNAVTSIGLLRWSGGGEAGDELLLDPAFRGMRGAGQELGEQACLRFEAGRATVLVAGREIVGLCRTFAQVERDCVLALVGSSGHLEISVREGNAARRLGLRLGDVIELYYTIRSSDNG